MLDVQAAARFLFKPSEHQARRSITSMTQADQQADEAARLEAALLRIQQAHARSARPVSTTAPGGRVQMPEPAGSLEISARLDTLIAELRALLGAQG